MSGSDDTVGRRGALDMMDLAARVRRGERLLGGLVRMSNESLVELVGLVGMDFVVLDAEHGPVDQLELAHHITAAEAVGIPAMVRVGGLGELLRVLDLGAAGVIFPHVDSVSDAEEVVQAVHYPPRGRRGFAAYTRAGRYGLLSGAEHLARYAAGPLVVAMIESEAAVAAAAQIAAVNGVDLLFLGPADLAADLGILGGDQAPVSAALAQVRTAAGGRVLSICGDEATARAHFDAGSQLVVYNIQHAVSATMMRLASAAPGRRPATGTPAEGREPLVLLSGMLGDSTVWDEVVEDLSDVACPVFPRIDQDDTVSAMAQSVLAGAPPTFSLAGHSLGAIVALEVVRRAPERVTRLALLNSSARKPSAGQLEAWGQLARRTTGGDFDSVARQLGNDTLAGPNRTAALVTRNSQMATSVGPEGFLRQLAAQASRPDLLPSLAKVAVPTLVVTGALDDVSRPELQEELADGIPVSQHVVLKQAGHMSPLEAPHEISRALRGWLTRA